IMHTHAPSTLAEFFRVLKPGGRVYACLDGDGWSHYLIRERGQKEPNLIEVGKTTLYKTAWHRARNRGFGPATWSLDADAIRRLENAGVIKPRRRREKIIANIYRRLFPSIVAN